MSAAIVHNVIELSTIGVSFLKRYLLLMAEAYGMQPNV